MRQPQKLAAIVILAGLATTSCGSVVRQGRAPVYLVIDTLEGIAGGTTVAPASGFLLSDVLGSRTSPAPCSSDSPCPTIFNDSGSVKLRASLKDVGTVTTPTTASSNNDVTINRYRVSYRRSDGRNVQGVDVPYAFEGATTGTVAAGGNLSLGFELVRHAAKEEAPLLQLIYNSTIITTIADVTFYGRDQVGNEVNVTGSIQVDFGNFGDR